MKNVVIGYVHNGSVRQKFMQSLMSLANYDREHSRFLEAEHQILSVEGLYLPSNRNKIVRAMLGIRAVEWLLFIDTDIVFGVDALALLMASADPLSRQVVSGLYFTYMGDKGKLLPVWTEKTNKGEFQTVTKFTGGVQKLYGTGMGFCLIHRRAFERVYEKYKDDAWPWFAHDPCSMENERLGEDNTFCKRAAEVGVDIWGDCRVVVSHIKSREENLDTFVASLGNQKSESRIII